MAVWVAVAAYFLCFGAMNWLLYESLLVPHGDSAMYEEHVWNLLHGKGFRSYLDNGRLFLGEHIQVIHLGVIPLYIFWPSHVLLELCQSAFLALGAVPVYRIARRHSGSSGAATCLAAAYLLYVPMQFLDIAIDFKTFRPNSFEIPFLLFAIDSLERYRYRPLIAWLGLALLCQEDAATIIAPLGIWIAVRHWLSQRNIRRVAPAGPAAHTPGASGSASGMGYAPKQGYAAWLGAGLAIFGAAYVILVIKVVLPWFRGGAEVHFARYFADLGTTSGEIVSGVLANPGLVLGKLIRIDSAAFALALLAPLGFLPLLSPGRLAIAAPLFGVLCLSEITNSPLHHFHAGLIPILFWAAAAGLGNAPGIFENCSNWWRRRGSPAFSWFSRYERPVEFRGSNEPDAARHRIPPDIFHPTGKTLPAEKNHQVPRAEPRDISAGEATVRTDTESSAALVSATWAVLCSLLIGLFSTRTPLGIGFWDPGSRAYWKNLYVPGERARQFPTALALVPRNSRVASTDYIHPRFTHFARSYDYSLYRPVVPDDTEYIVIDTHDIPTHHVVSGIKRPDQVKEYRDRDKWELLEDRTSGYFIVLKRRGGVPRTSGTP